MGWTKSAPFCKPPYRIGKIRRRAKFEKGQGHWDWDIRKYQEFRYYGRTKGELMVSTLLLEKKSGFPSKQSKSLSAELGETSLRSKTTSKMENTKFL